MEYKELGTTAIKISRIGLGCWAIGGHGYGHVEEKKALRTVAQAFDMGINFFDTADVYGFGRSEELLSKGLGAHRYDAFIATKFGVRWNAKGEIHRDCSRKTIEEALEGSLRRLKLEAIPLYQVHWHDGITPIPEIMGTLKDFQDQGKIQFIGCTNFTLEMIEEAEKTAEISSVQSPFNVCERERKGLLEECFFRKGMGTVVYSVLARGFLSGKYSATSSFAEGDTRGRDLQRRREKILEIVHRMERLKQIGERYKKSPAQVAIKWVLDQAFITTAIVGAKDEEQVVENVQALHMNLSPEDQQMISDLPNENLKT